LGLKAHLTRLFQPARRLGIQSIIAATDLQMELAALLARVAFPEARIRLILTTEKNAGSVYVAIEPLRIPAPAIYRKGVRVVTTAARRDHPELKTTGFIEASQKERRQLARSTAYEGLLVQDGRILEGITSNFFYVKDGTLGTARRGILNGVTRRQVLRLAAGQGLRVDYHALRLSQIPEIDEAFLTSSSRGIVPIVTIDERQVGCGRVGEWARKLMQAYDADVVDRAELIVPVSSTRSTRST
jgi:branched-chain amino acid aminotransferase